MGTLVKSYLDNCLRPFA